MDVELAGFGLQRDNYVLTVGGSDRDELYGARVARTLGIPYVRATYLPAPTVQKIRTELVQNGLDQYSRLLEYPSDVELRALYAGARIVCLPTMTKTNPAGLSAMVEAMACGALVGIPENLAEGYVVDGINGLILRAKPEEFAESIARQSARHDTMRISARSFAASKLNVSIVATNMRSYLLGKE
jgi:glycosyltransferase involved in cell wall biosynthesis